MEKASNEEPLDLMKWLNIKNKCAKLNSFIAIKDEKKCCSQENI